jgi:hypothetical protein
MANDYAGWGWERTLGGVLGIEIPDRSQVTGQSWLIIQHNAPASSGMHQIWTATSQDNNTTQSITVYLNPAVYAAGGAWDNFVNMPSASLSGVPAGNYGALPMDPPTFTAAQEAVASVASLLNAKTQEFGNLSADVGSGSSGFQGSGGEVVSNVLDRLRQITAGMYQQMTSPVAYSDTIGAAGDSATKFLNDSWSAYTSWTQVPQYSPLGALVQVVQGIGGGDPKNTPYGDLTTDAAWALVESAAKALWLGTLTGGSGGFSGLDPLSQNALGQLVNQYATTTGILDPLLRASPAQAGHSTDPENSSGSSGGTGNGVLNSGSPGGAGGGPSGAPGAPGAPGGAVPVGAVPGGAVPGGTGPGGGSAVTSDVVGGPAGAVGGPSGVPGGAVPGGAVPGGTVPGGGPGAPGAGSAGGPVVSANSLGATSALPVPQTVAPLTPPAAGGVPASAGAAVPAQSLSAQGGLLIPTALLVNGAGGTTGTNSGTGLRGSTGSASALDALLAASQLGALSGAIGRPGDRPATRDGAAGDESSDPLTENSIGADSITGTIPVRNTTKALVAGSSLGSDPNGAVLQQSVIPTFAARPGSPTVTVTSFNTQAVPSVQPLSAGEAGATQTALAVPGGAPPGTQPVLAVPGGGPPGVPGASTPGAPGAGAANGDGGPLGPGGPFAAGGPEAGLMGGRMGMMPPGIMPPGMTGAPQQNTERVRDAFAPQDEEYWGTEPGVPGAPLAPDCEPEQGWPDTEPSPFDAIGIGADRAAATDKINSGGRVR